MNTSGLPVRSAKENFFKDTPLFQNAVTCRQLYTDEIGLSDLHFHDFIEVSIVTEGAGIHRIFNSELECAKGDIYILNTGVPHGYFARSENECPTVCNLLFDAGSWFHHAEARPDDPHFCYGIFQSNPPFSYAVLTPDVLDDVMHLYHSIEQETDARRADWLDAVRSYLTLLLVTVGRYVNRAEQTAALHRNWFLVSAAIRMAAEHIGEPDVTLGDIAASLHISKSYLSRLFHRITGTAFSEYMLHSRLQRAQRLLRETQLSNAEVAAACGMRDIQGFYRLFKSETGMTPHSFRRMHTENASAAAAAHTAMLLEKLCAAVQHGRIQEMDDALRQALQQPLSAEEILRGGLLPGMSIIGRRFRSNEVYIPEVLLASRAMNHALQQLQPLLIGSPQKRSDRICIGTVQSDLHDIGKNLARIMLESKGFDVIDLGVDVAPEVFIRTALEQNCRLICCSVLLTTSMNSMAALVQLADRMQVRDRFKILVGGAPVTEDFCRRIGADLYAADATTTAELAEAFFDGE
ncbi:MAG: helix-turn-helix domain-containing protein [Oscillospiraceae bacterium]|nr:helix-turn-helix domain-containing protein [Oscillospiraceae bacterium]